MKVNFSKTKLTLLSAKGFVLMENFLKYLSAFLVNHKTPGLRRDCAIP